MQYHEFLGQVQSRAHLASLEEAEAVTEAVLEALGERLTAGAADNLAAQLPEGIGRFLRQAEPASLEGGVDAFLEAVSDRTGEDPGTAAHHARAVLAVLRTAVSPGQLEHTLAQLPEELDRLVLAGSEGEFDL